MNTISIDIETYSSVNLAKSGVYRYAESPDFEILLFGYSADGGPVQVVDLACGEKIPDEIRAALTDDSVIKTSFNAQFERICLSRYLGYPTGTYLDPSSWRCSMVWSAYMGLPLSLAGVGAVLGLDKQKLSEGKDLIRYFCQPCAATKSNGGRTRNLPEHAPEKWELFKAYNIRDVEVEMGIQARLQKYPVPESEWEHYHLDQRINDRGIMVDRALVREAIRCDEEFKQAHLEKAKEVTGLENPNSPVQLKGWLSEHGVETDTLSKAAVLELLEDAEGEVEQALMLRKELAKSSVKKYTAMETVACSDDRARGLIQFYGANRTGRFSGKLIQVQNLPANHLPDLKHARDLVRGGFFEAVETLYDSVPVVLSELVRTALVPKPGSRFYVADFAAIEARVIAWLAGEKWRQDLFASGGDIYCQSASQMFGVPVVKHGVNGHLRQKGKIAELACIAEGQLVLTDHGEVPIEQVTLEMRVWDGDSWVRHDGVICNGLREVITYEGLTATPDHLVWVEGKQEPIQFGDATTRGAHLIQTRYGGREIWVGGDNRPRKTMEQKRKSLLCADRVQRLWINTVANKGCPDQWKKQGVSTMLSAAGNPTLVRSQTHSCQTAMRESERQGLSKLWCKRNPIQFSVGNSGGKIFDRNIWNSETRIGNRSDRQQRGLCTGEHTICYASRKQPEQAVHSFEQVRTAILAVFKTCGYKNVIQRSKQSGNHSGSTQGSCRETKKLEVDRGKDRVYDIRNAGPHHRYTVSGKLVHNCGYGGSSGALKAMGALSLGLTEDELKPLVNAWRQANPHITRLWWDVDSAVKTCIKEKTTTATHGIRFIYQSGMMFIQLPSGRRLTYVKPKIGVNRFGGESVTYEGVGEQKKWMRIESYGPKFVENIVQATARDILAEAMLRLDKAGYQIVMHVHDEAVIEAPDDTSLEDICSIMGQTPDWAEGLILRADGYVCDFYKKD